MFATIKARRFGGHGWDLLDCVVRADDPHETTLRETIAKAFREERPRLACDPPERHCIDGVHSSRGTAVHAMLDAPLAAVVKQMKGDTEFCVTIFVAEEDSSTEAERTAETSVRREPRSRELEEFRKQRGHEEGSGRRDVGRTRRPEEPSSKTISDGWEGRFRELEEFEEEHGHCRVPESRLGGLGRWVERQRAEKRSGRLDAGRAQKLEELGFPWDAAGSEQGEARLQEPKGLEEEEHDHSTGGEGLGPLEARPAPQPKEEPGRRRDAAPREVGPWEARFRQLREFREEHGHCDVPYARPGGLGMWARHQRRGGTKGERRRQLNADRIRRLEELDFHRDAAASDELPLEEETAADPLLPPDATRHDIGKAPNYASAYRDGAWIYGNKIKYAQYTCRWPGCPKLIRNYCVCNPARWLCPSHVVQHAVEATRDECMLILESSS